MTSFDDIDYIGIDYDEGTVLIEKEGQQYIYDLEDELDLVEKMIGYGVEYEVYGQDEIIDEEEGEEYG